MYLLSPTSDGNVKIRGGVIDIKILEEVNGDRFERWRPVLKEPLPISSDKVETVFHSLSLPPPRLGERAYDEESFLACMSQSSKPPAVVPVSKRRWGYLHRGALLERAEVHAGGALLRTVSVEHSDSRIVASVVDEFGFRKFVNTNYVTILKRKCAGWEPE